MLRTKRELVAKQRPPHWAPPNIFRPAEVFTEVEVIEAAQQKRRIGVLNADEVDPDRFDQ
jgi:hypothetical protein